MRLLTAALLTLLPAFAIAQNDTEILLLGTAGGPPLRLNRSEPATLLTVDGQRYLIDCGTGTIRRLLRAGVPSQTIRTIFITHHHPDHDLGLADVMANDVFTMSFAGDVHPIDIYGPPQTKQFVDAAFDYLKIPFGVFAAEGPQAGLGSQAVTNPFVAHEIQKEGVVFQDDKIRVIAAENSHYALMPEASRAAMKSYSYRIETPHGTVVFTGDTGPSDAVTRLAKDADVLISESHESAGTTPVLQALAQQHHWSAARLKDFVAHMDFEHLTTQQVGEMATKARAKSVLLYHFNPTDPAVFVAGVKKFFSGPVFAGADLDRYCLSASKLSLCH